jgi:hypothetical protein
MIIPFFFAALSFFASGKFSKRIQATAPAVLVPVAAFDGRKFFVRQSQFRLLAARF